MTFEGHSFSVEFQPFLWYIKGLVLKRAPEFAIMQTQQQIRNFAWYCIDESRSHTHKQIAVSEKHAISKLTKLVSVNFDLFLLGFSKRMKQRSRCNLYTPNIPLSGDIICPVCQYGKCDSQLICCNAGIHKVCLDEYLSVPFSVCMLCRYPLNEKENVSL